MNECEKKHASVAGILGMDAVKTHDFLGSLLIASVIIIIVLSGAATIILGTHIYYTHIHRMTEAGYVLRTHGGGLLKAPVTEWVKEGTPDARINQPAEEKKEDN